MYLYDEWMELIATQVDGEIQIFYLFLPSERAEKPG